MLVIIFMARPKKNRRIKCNPGSYYFKPAGMPLRFLKEIILEGDELEAIRLADLLNLSQEEAAAKMKISRPTFGRIVNIARTKIADAIINGKAIRVSDEFAAENDMRIFSCGNCGFKLYLKHKGQLPYCPKCNNQSIGEKMKIAVATNNQVNVTGHLGRCRLFLVYEVEGDKIINKELRENTFTHHNAGQGHEHGEHNHGEHNHSHQALTEALNDCNAIIFQSGGWRVVEDLKANNITPILTDENLADEAVLKYLKGELEINEDNVCRHH